MRKKGSFLEKFLLVGGLMVIGASVGYLLGYMDGIKETKKQIENVLPGTMEKYLDAKQYNQD